MYQALIDAEGTAVIGAGPWERTESRTAQRNGSRPRVLTTTAGDLQLRIPKRRAGSFFPSLQERRRVDQALFHWESQTTTRVASPTGQRYLHHAQLGSHIVLFVRETATDDLGAAPFLCLGSATYVEHRGERPIAITWRLHRRMPGEVFHVASVVARRTATLLSPVPPFVPPTGPSQGVHLSPPTSATC